MLYSVIRDNALKLINQYSIAGEIISRDYNNQDDYLLRIPGLINDALMTVATTYKRFRKEVKISSLAQETFGNMTRCTMPEDFWQFISGGIKSTDKNGCFVRYNKCRFGTTNVLYIPTEDIKREMTVEYYAYPEQISLDPKDSDKVKAPPEVLLAIPYYVAAHIVMYDDAFAYSALYNEFETRLMRTQESVTYEHDPVEDAYSGGGDMYGI